MPWEWRGNHHFLFSFFFLPPLKERHSALHCGECLFKQRLSEGVEFVEDCWKKALCVCWQRAEIGTVGGLPTLLFKYTQRYWVTPAGVGVDSADLD